MVKMKLGSDLEDQQVSKLNEYLLVVDRIRKAWRTPRKQQITKQAAEP
jgi:hypothetical protein